jgi:hypothetical protein
VRLQLQSRKASRITSLEEAYSPVSTASRTLEAISGGSAMLTFSTFGMWRPGRKYSYRSVARSSRTGSTLWGYQTADPTAHKNPKKRMQKSLNSREIKSPNREIRDLAVHCNALSDSV